MQQDYFRKMLKVLSDRNNVTVGRIREAQLLNSIRLCFTLMGPTAFNAVVSQSMEGVPDEDIATFFSTFHSMFRKTDISNLDPGRTLCPEHVSVAGDIVRPNLDASLDMITWNLLSASSYIVDKMAEILGWEETEAF